MHSRLVLQKSLQCYKQMNTKVKLVLFLNLNMIIITVSHGRPLS